MELTQLQVAIVAECAALGNRVHEQDRRSTALRLFEMCCACEQILSDLHFEVSDGMRARLHATARAFTTLASQIAGSLFLGDDAASLEDIVTRIAAHAAGLGGPATTMGDLSQQYVKLPECFMRDLVDLGDYARFARERLLAVQPETAIVVGIRTTGSYLAPIWDAALRASGIPGVALTARPRRHPRIGATGRFTDTAPTDMWAPCEEDVNLVMRVIADRNRQAITAFVVDDLAFTGSQFVRVDNYLRDIGIDGWKIVFVQNAPLIMNSLTTTAYDRLSDRQVWAAPKAPDAPSRLDHSAVRFFGDLMTSVDGAGHDVDVTSVRLAPPTFVQRHLAARTTVPVEQFVHFNPRARDRHYIIEATVDGRSTRLFAKVFGVGFFAEQELQRIRQFEEVAYRVFAHVGGFLCYEWIAGETLGPDGAHLLSDDDIDQLADYAVTLSRFNRVGQAARDSYSRDVVGRLRRAIDIAGPHELMLESAVSTFLREGQSSVPLVNAPRNQGYWHHIRAHDGALKRTHLDLGEWSWQTDVAEELAATAIELSLSPAQVDRLIARYVTQTADHDVASRMTLAAVSYVARTLDSYRYWDGQIEQIPTRYRRAPDDPQVLGEQMRRNRILRELDRALFGAEQGVVSRV